MVACHPCVVVGPSKRCMVPTSSGWLAPVNSAPSPPSPPRRKVQRFRFGVPCRGSCSWPPSRMPAAMVKCNVRPGCTVGADRSMVCTVNHRSCPASGPHPAPRRARQQTRSLAPVRFRRFQGNAATVCTVHAGTLPRHGALSADATVQRCTLRLAVRLRRSSGTRSAWWFPSLRRSSGPLPPWRRGRLRADAAARTAASCSARWRAGRRPVHQLRVRAEPRVSRRHAVVVELSLDGDVRPGPTTRAAC